jgi:hypothetical protein
VRRLITALAAVAAVAALLSSPAGAVQGATPDTNNTYSYVGLSVFYEDGVPLWRCSGTMVAAQVYLTAGHCTGVDPDSGAVPDHAEVWFSPGPIAFGNYPGTGSCAGFVGYPCKGDVGGTPHPMPGWNGFLTVPNTHDMGVVVLDSAPNKGVAKLAPEHYLDRLATQRGRQNVNFTVVGYGVQFERPNLEVAVRQRFIGTNQIQNLRSNIAGGYNLIMTDSAGKGTGGGGTCFGDSGGPILHTDSAGQQWQVAVISFGTKYCHGTSGAFRVDNTQARQFLAGFGVPLN